jgi:hypothetical protein
MLALPAPAPIVADPPSPKRSAKGTTAEVEDGFAKFWQRYPREVGKGQARRAFAAALMKTTLPDLLAGVDRLNAHHAAVKTEQRFIPHPSTWLNGERWSDDLAGSSVSAPVPTEDPATRQWRARLASYRERGLWLDAYGPRPGEPRCEAPKQILAEMGLAA